MMNEKEKKNYFEPCLLILEMEWADVITSSDGDADNDVAFPIMDI